MNDPSLSINHHEPPSSTRHPQVEDLEGFAAQLSMVLWMVNPVGHGKYNREYNGQYNGKYHASG